MTATKNFNGGNGSDADTPVLQMIDRTQPEAENRARLTTSQLSTASDYESYVACCIDSDN